MKDVDSLECTVGDAAQGRCAVCDVERLANIDGDEPRLSITLRYQIKDDHE